MERAIKDLCQLSRSALVEQAAIGIQYVLEVVERLEPTALHLSQSGRHHASRVLSSLAAEEAAKVLILIDALRCPVSRPAERCRTLRYFYDHVAKGIYVQTCSWHPNDFAEFVRYIELLRPEFYLDGPNGVDWIFPNDITQSREDDLYVGYIRDDSERPGEGERRWTLPDNDGLFGYLVPPIVTLVRALRDVGATTSAGLKAISDVWGEVNVTSSMRIEALEELNQQTLISFEAEGLVSDAQVRSRAIVQTRWLFPLWLTELRVQKVDKKELREVRRRWFPS